MREQGESKERVRRRFPKGYIDNRWKVIKKEIMMVKKDSVEIEEETEGLISRKGEVRRKKLEDRGGICKRGYAGESREDKRHNGKK